MDRELDQWIRRKEIMLGDPPSHLIIKKLRETIGPENKIALPKIAEYCCPDDIFTARYKRFPPKGDPELFDLLIKLLSRNRKAVRRQSNIAEEAERNMIFFKDKAEMALSLGEEVMNLLVEAKNQGPMKGKENGRELLIRAREYFASINFNPWFFPDDALISRSNGFVKNSCGPMLELLDWLIRESSSARRITGSSIP